MFQFMPMLRNNEHDGWANLPVSSCQKNVLVFSSGHNSLVCL